MAQISVRPNRIKFIKVLNESIKRINKEADAYEVAEKQYKKDMEAWRKSADLSPSNIKETYINTARYAHGEPDAPESVTVKLKKYPANKPKSPKQPQYIGFSKTQAIREIETVIKMLELTDDELVNASVANKVAEYL